MRNLIKKLLSIFFPNRVYKIRNGIAKGLIRKGGFAFIPTYKKLTSEDLFLLDLDLVGQNIYDVGGNIGLLSLFFTKAVGPKGKVIAFEPNPVCYSELINNLKANNFSHTKAYQFALGKENSKEKLIYNPLHTGTGSINHKIKNQVIDRSKSVISIDIEVFSLDYLIETKQFPIPDLIKIDVEGLEYDVLIGMLKTMKKIKPKLFIEIHGANIKDKVENIKRIVKMLLNNKYSIFHVELGKMINESNASNAKEGHIFCT
tara:strand:- start:3492 stop:4268 length:777 start_codon:yes stop_codon:yes gene_type:complete